MAEAHYLLGLCLRGSGRVAEAAAALERSAVLSPGHIPTREELADVYGALGRRLDEIEQLQLVAMLDRSHVERQVAVGLAQARAGQEELAVLTLGNALERTPDAPVVYGALGQVWLARAVARRDRVFLSKALEALERGAADSLATSDVLAAYGRALVMDNQLEAAERVLQQATRRYPVEPQSLGAYAAVAERHGHFEAARTALIEYGALVPDDPDAGARAAAIARLSLRLNDRETAAAWIAHGLEREPSDPTLQALARRVP
jgi:Flp pilus assembly protein TadD